MKNFLKFALLVFVSVHAKAQIPTATIVTPASTVCTGVSVTFSSVTSNTPTEFLWSVSPSTSVTIVPDKTSPSLSMTFARPGVHTLSLQVSNASGTTTAVRSISVIQSAKAAFNASLVTSGYPNQLVLTNFSSSFTGNSWVFSHGAPTSTLLNTSVTYSASGAYSVMLIAYGTNACNDTASYRFFVSDTSGITAPTVFTPNNDNVNDVFKPISRGITEMKVWVYNRFGTIICSWDKVNGSWDGYTTSGEPCQEGVYFYIIEAVGFDGKNYKMKNSLTLIR